MSEPQDTSRFLMTPQPKDAQKEDPSQCPNVPGAFFTTGQGVQKDAQDLEMKEPNGDAAASAETQTEGPHRDVGVAVAAVMLVAEMAGSGVLALPRSLAETGWPGILLIVILGAAVGFSGSRLGICWVLLERKHLKYRHACRTPYPAIGYHALGRPGRLLVVFAQNVTLVGVTTVFLILSGELLQALLGQVEPVVFGSHCYCTLLVGALLIPLSWLGTPKDFWPTAIVAMLTTVFAVIVVVVELFLELPKFEDRTYEGATFRSFFLGFGTILFSFGGAATFPTIQNDMKHRAKFPYSVAIAFAVLLVMYLPISTIGYGIVGSAVNDNILLNVEGIAVQVTRALVVAHLFTAYVILVNPVTQGIEEAFNLPTQFGWKRCVVRSLLVLFEVLIGLLIPDFSKILKLVGASTVTMMSFILPPICYLKLSDEVDIMTGEPMRPVPFYERIVLYIVLLAGLVGGATSTFSAIENLGRFSSGGPASCFF